MPFKGGAKLSLPRQLHCEATAWSGRNFTVSAVGSGNELLRESEGGPWWAALRRLTALLQPVAGSLAL